MPSPEDGFTRLDKEITVDFVNTALVALVQSRRLLGRFQFPRKPEDLLINEAEVQAACAATSHAMKVLTAEQRREVHDTAYFIEELTSFEGELD